MYPNGIPGAKPKESSEIRFQFEYWRWCLGWIRREKNKVRSPVLLPRSDSSIPDTVPLEFEEDEDFVARDVEDDDSYGGGLQVPTTTSHRNEASSTSRGTSREGGTSADSISSCLETPANTSIHHHLPLVDDSDVVGTVDDKMHLRLMRLSSLIIYLWFGTWTKNNTCCSYACIEFEEEKEAEAKLKQDN